MTGPSDRTVTVSEKTLRRLRDCIEEGTDYYRTPRDLNQAQNIVDDLIDELPAIKDPTHA